MTNTILHFLFFKSVIPQRFYELQLWMQQFDSRLKFGKCVHSFVETFPHDNKPIMVIKQGQSQNLPVLSLLSHHIPKIYCIWCHIYLIFMSYMFKLSVLYSTFLLSRIILTPPTPWPLTSLRLFAQISCPWGQSFFYNNYVQRINISVFGLTEEIWLPGENPGTHRGHSIHLDLFPG